MGGSYFDSDFRGRNESNKEQQKKNSAAKKSAPKKAEAERRAPSRDVASDIAAEQARKIQQQQAEERARILAEQWRIQEAARQKAAQEARDKQAAQDAARTAAMDLEWRRKNPDAYDPRNPLDVPIFGKKLSVHGADMQAEVDKNPVSSFVARGLSGIPNGMDALDAIYGGVKSAVAGAPGVVDEIALQASQPNGLMGAATNPWAVDAARAQRDTERQAEVAKADANRILNEKWANNMKYLTEGQLKASTSDPGKIREAKRQDFDKMSNTDKGALFWNSMLEQAIKRDQADLKKIATDKNDNGTIELSELKKGTGLKGYRANYRDVFGDYADFENAPGDKDVIYSPRVVGLLEKYGVGGASLNLDQFVKGSGYITDEDLASNAKARKAGGLSQKGMSSYIQGRDSILLNQLRPKLDEFTKMAENSQVDVGGAKVGLDLFNTTVEQRGQFVDNSALAMESEKADQLLALFGQGKYGNAQLGGREGMDVSMLADQEQMGLVNNMQKLRAEILAGNGDPYAKLTDTEKQQLVDRGIEPKRWLKFLKEIKRSEKKNTTASVRDRLTGSGEAGSATEGK